MKLSGKLRRLQHTISPEKRSHISEKEGHYGEKEDWVATGDLKTFWRLIRLARPLIPFIIAALALVLLNSVVQLLLPQYQKALIDGYLVPVTDQKLTFLTETLIVLGGPPPNGIIILAAFYIGTILIHFSFEYSGALLMNFTSQKLMFSHRMNLVSHLHQMACSFYDRTKVGRLITRATNDIESLNEMFSSVMTTLIRDVFVFIGALVLMFYESWQLTLIVLIVLPVVYLLNINFRKAARTAYHRSRARLSRINAFLAENLSGMKIVQMFNREKWNLLQFRFINHDLLRAMLREHNVSNIFQPAMAMLTNIITGIIIYVGGLLTMGEDAMSVLSIGTFIVFLNYINLAIQPINDFASKYHILQSALVSGERIFSILDLKERVAAPVDPVQFHKPVGNSLSHTLSGLKPIDHPKEDSSIPLFKGQVEFKNVWFAYLNENWILKDISFSISAGESVAFVGPTGSGKTTILSLVNRFYDVQKGSILIDGIDIKNLDEKEIHSHIGMVLQDSYLFSQDILSNIRMNEESITFEDAHQAAKLVNADFFIQKLPNGYQEVLMERGASLSIGQRQLLGLARALAFNRKILIMDEATANVDTDTEVMIQSGLKRLMKDRTSLIVAHRLSTIFHCDRIIVIHNGCIEEMGKHDELLQNRGLYYQLYLKQFKGQSLKRYF